MKTGGGLPITPLRFGYVTDDEQTIRVGLVGDPADIIADLMEAVQDQAERIAKLEARLEERH